MKSLKNKTVIVAGGTGNVGSFLVKDLLKRGAAVVVPSRSKEKIQELETFLKKHSMKLDLNQLYFLHVDIGDENEIEHILNEIVDLVGEPDAVISSLGRFLPAPTLLDTSVSKLRQVINDYLITHFIIARTFLQRFKEHGKGTYVFINGPLALKPWKESGAGLVSTATAGQQMLFKVLAQELEGSEVTVTELINYAYIRNRTTQSSSIISGEATAAYASYLVSDQAEGIHGKSIKFRSDKQLEVVDINI